MTASGRLVSLVLAGAVWTARGEPLTTVLRERLTDGWEFMRADGSASETNSAAWKDVRVPHDWGVERPFDPARPYGDAYLEPTGVGWYRIRFGLKETAAQALAAGGHLFFESNGAMSNARVWVNGHEVGGWAYGYTPFRCELTACVRATGTNELLVRCDNKPDSSRWYTGGGLYRECRLALCPKDYLVPGSVAITTPEVSKASATVRIAYEMSESGRRTREFKVANPRLWDVDDPHLYEVEIEGERFRYGIRTIAFHGDERGFMLNGRRVSLNGVSLHHDLGVLGAAFNRGAMRRRFLKLKEAGVNAVRCSHNEEDPAFLDLCDELGLLVKNEIFDQWEAKGHTGRTNDYSNLFREWHEKDLRAWIRADRNHPSVIMWSLGNEIDDGFESRGTPTARFIATARTLDRIAREEDPTRPTTNSNNNPVNWTNDFACVLGLMGCNYFGYLYGEIGKANPGRAFFASESQCMSASRGEFAFPVVWGWTQETTFAPYVSSFGTEACGWDGDPAHGWACPPDVQWHWMDRNPACMGEFVWTGWDYLGGPYWTGRIVKGRPGFKGIHSCNTGFFDLAGFPKDTFWLYQSRWRPDHPMAHILPHWNWPERRGMVTPVHVFTSGDAGELFLNGRSLGIRRKVPDDWKHAYRLSWDDVVYEPGELKVVVTKGGRPWATDTVVTTSPEARLEIGLETPRLRTDGEDLMFANLSVCDAQGRVVPRAHPEVTFFLEGPGEIVATDNGDETDFTSFHASRRRAFNGRLQAIVRARPDACGELVLTATAPGLAAAKIAIPLDPSAQKRIGGLDFAIIQ